MCGISGMVYHPDRGVVDPDRLLAMCRALTHRGPDDEGMYVTAHAGLAVRRLAVVDVRAGRQPIVVTDGYCPSCGRPAPVRAYADLVRGTGGYLVLDDTQALGVLGAAPTKAPCCPAAAP